MVAFGHEEVPTSLVLTVKQADLHLLEAIIAARAGGRQRFGVPHSRSSSLPTANRMRLATLVLLLLGDRPDLDPIRPHINPGATARIDRCLIR